MQGHVQPGNEDENVEGAAATSGQVWVLRGRVDLLRDKPTRETLYCRTCVFWVGTIGVRASRVDYGESGHSGQIRTTL